MTQENLEGVGVDNTTSQVRAVPQHIAFILDGNRRWARGHYLSVDEGHRAGILKVFDVLAWCEDAGVEVVTMWLLAMRNLKRSDDELAGLFRVYEEVAERLADGPWRVRAMGALDLLPKSVTEAFRRAEESTRHSEGLQANIALAYDGRAEIVRAVRCLCDGLANAPEPGSSSVISEEAIGQYLFTAGQPDPDLVVRTSGEKRLSGFLTWQTAQSELYFCADLWPDFTREHLTRALDHYARRDRRFGL
ncbi:MULTISPECIES: polyprenyl diphosphate synthase [Streptomyces]|jgi:short-chain Z-isoprenyl diphosphate synthase|uniref:Isoprenyl transferase n=2 Tax=Streptomyces TaxID=1883 RepID=A0ABT3VDF7_9ACTN|nr:MULTISPECIES: polyprenyl diphosphate synthase [Streptomyces]MCW8096899.1 polyprenyl diphosphate synthase [Streptomyces tauricus]MCX4237851.1 polyprenyl diphosphate synthase [Streptomyces ortus]WSD74958.1 polyprenyl diphosphate synthase [Streptomyces sp. NBC_01558]